MAYDNDPNAVETYNENLSPVCKYQEIDRNLLLENEPTIVVATPPCQGFSNVGIGSPTDPRNYLLLDACEIISRSRPNIAVIENVASLTNSKNRPVLERAIHMLREAGFYVQTSVLNGEDYSIPQRRKRAFIIARSGNREFLGSDFGRKRRALGVGKVLSSMSIELDSQSCLLVHANKKDTSILRRIGPGQKLCNVRASDACVHTWEIPEVFGRTNRAEREVLVAVQKLRRRNRVRKFGDADPVSDTAVNEYLGWKASKQLASLLAKQYLRRVDGKIDLTHTFNGKYRRLDPNASSPTVDTKFGDVRLFVHPFEDRSLSVREAARIQCFPDSFSFVGNVRAKFRQVGNAVPPPLGRRVARMVKSLV